MLTGGLSDWNPVGGNGHGPDTPANECSAFYGLLDTIYMAEMAEGIGEAADAVKYKAQAAAARVAYHGHFWNPATKVYSKGSQCSTMMALWLGVVPPEHEATAVATMVNNVKKNKYGQNHLDGGIILTTFMFDTLTKYGYAGLALDTLLTDVYPSFGYMISQGGTTLWEAFEGNPHKQAGSWNHIMYGGGVGTFVYSALAGIDTVLNGTTAGWSRMLFKPEPAALLKLGRAAATHTTRFGNASISWEMGSKALQLTVTVPTGCTAEAHFPQLAQLGAAALTVTDSSAQAPVWKAGKFMPGVAGVHGGSLSAPVKYGPFKGVASVVLELGSGTYPFSVSA